MRTVEEYWQYFEKIGFVKSFIPGVVRYSLDSSLGKGYFELLGDTEICMACISDLMLYKPCVILEAANERVLEFGQFYTGEVSFYQRKNDVLPIEHGLNALVSDPLLWGYKRMEADVQFFNVGFAYREKFFETLPYALPEDFWETAAAVLNPDVLTIPSLTLICDQIKNCRLSETALRIFINGKALEAFGIILDYIYENRKKSPVNLSLSDRELIGKVKELLRENIASPPAVADLAKAIGMNSKKLMRGFKHMNGTTIYGYLKQIRMVNAAELLLETEQPISTITAMVGYHGDGHFQKAFRDVYGTTPGKLRKENESIRL